MSESFRLITIHLRYLTIKGYKTRPSKYKINESSLISETDFLNTFGVDLKPCYSSHSFLKAVIEVDFTFLSNFKKIFLKKIDLTIPNNRVVFSTLCIERK